MLTYGRQAHIPQGGRNNKIMSENQALFLKETRKILRQIFIPVASVIVLTVGGFAIAAPGRIKATEAKTRAIEQKTDAFIVNYVSNDMMISYLNDLHLLTQMLADHEHYDKAEFDRINQRIDRLIESIPRSATRGKSVQ